MSFAFWEKGWRRRSRNMRFAALTAAAAPSLGKSVTRIGPLDCCRNERRAFKLNKTYVYKCAWTTPVANINQVGRVGHDVGKPAI